MSDVVLGCFSCMAFIVIVLFNVGCFTPNWIRTEEISVTNFTNTSTVSTTTRICHHGLLYSIDCPNSKNVFDHLLIGLNIAVSVCLTVIPFFWCCMTMFGSCCSNSGTDNEDASELCCCFYAFFYAVGGLLGLVSIVLVVAKFDRTDLGWSFFLMVAAIAIVLLQVILHLTYSVYSRRSTEKCSVFFVYRRKQYEIV